MTPSGLASRPEVEPDDLRYLDAFRALDRSRAGGHGGPLPLSIQEVHAFLLLVGEGRADERLKFLRMMQRMDDVFLKHAQAKMEAESSK